MRLVLRVLGFPVATIDVQGLTVEAEEEEEPSSSRIEGGSAHNFERDIDPVTPEDRYQGWEWDDKRKFGFRA